MHQPSIFFTHCNDTLYYIVQSPVSPDNISKKRERRLGKGVSSIDNTVDTASSNKLETKSTTSKSSVSDNLDVGILSTNQEDTEFDEVFTWVDHEIAPTRGRGGRRHGRRGGGHRQKQKQNLSRHKDKLLAKLYGSKISHTNNDINIIDTGIMQMDIARVNNPKTCDLVNQGYVNCTDGSVDSGETCAEACDGECCDGEDACTGFTGLICKDGYSCKGEASCYSGSIGFVVYGCNGFEACLYAGYYDGSIGAVRNSCVGPGACLYAAYRGGKVEGIEDSCNGFDACGFAASGCITYYEGDCSGDSDFEGGSIGMIKSSCIEGLATCVGLAYANGTVGDIVDSCEGNQACASAASYGGNIEGIEDSCLDGEFSCVFAAAGFADYDGTYDPNDGGSIGMIESSCIGEESCYGLAYYDGTVGDVRDSCDGFRSCNYAASYGGSIESITDSSCSGSEACNFTASNGGRIESITNSSCTGSGSCSYAASCDAYENDNCKAGRIGNISSSCEEEKSCYQMADEGGYVRNVLSSCLGISACERAAFKGSISDGIEDACLAEEACKSLGEDSTIDGAISDCCEQPGGCESLTYLPLCCVNATEQNRALQSCRVAPTLPPSKAPSSSPSMSPLSPTPSPTNSPSSAPTSAAPTVSLEPTQVTSSKSAKSKGRKSKQSKKSKTSKSAKALSMNLTTLDEDGSKILRKRIRKHAPGASGKLSSLMGGDEQ